MRNVKPGFTDPATIQSVRVLLPAADIPEPERVTRVQQDILDRLAAIPGVTSAAFLDQVPMEPFKISAIVAAEGQDYGPKKIPPTRRIRIISPGALQTLGTPLLMDTVAQELRHAARRLARTPVFTVAAATTLALAIAANAAIFTLVYRVVLNPLPYPDSQRLIALD